MPKQMIGRTSERAVLRDAFAAARSGRGEFVMITGEAGVGKSMLLTELATDARGAGVTVLTGRAVEGAGSYRPFAEALMPLARNGFVPDAPELRPYRAALGRLVPDWAMRSGPSVPETLVDPVLVLGEGLLRLLSGLAADRCVVVIEDLHWSDPETLALLDNLAAAITGSITAVPVLIAATVRHQPRAPGVERLIKSASTVIDVRRLEPAEVDEMIMVRHGTLPDEDRALIRERSEGLPLLVDELLAAAGGPDGSLASSVPSTFAALVEGRLRTLDDHDRGVLSAAAALGAQPDWDLVSLIADRDAADVVRALRRAVEAELLITDGPVLAWRHALTRDAVWAGLLAPERTALHRRAAEVIVARGGPAYELMAADHLLEAGDVAAGRALLLGVADRDLAAGALRSAEAILDRLAATDGLDPAVARRRVDLLSLSGRLDLARREGAAALEHAVGDAHAELCWRLARTAILLGSWSDADDYLARAARPDDPRTLILAADSAHGAGRIADAARLADAAVARAERSGVAELSCEAMIVHARILRLSDFEQAESVFRRAAELAAEHGLKPWRVEALLGWGSVELLYAEKSAAMAEARDLATELGLLVKATGAELILSDHLFVTRGPGAALEAAELISERGRVLRIPVFHQIGELIRGVPDAVAGHRGAVQARLARFPDADLMPEGLAQAHNLRATLAAVDQDLPAAAQHLDVGLHHLLTHGSAAPLHTFGFWVLLRTIVDDRGEEARSRLRGSAAALRRANRGALDYAEAVAAGRRGDVAEAERCYAAGEDALAVTPWWQRFLRLFTQECAVADGWGDPVPQLRGDLTAFEAAGEDRLARICRDLLRRAGAPTRRGRGDSTVPPRLRSLGVTSRELDVLSAVSAGSSNAQVAEQLFLSVRTVETHVGNLLAKTGAGNRTELREWYAQQTP